eukprot:1760239-Rhodomonas_salina.1
MALCRPSMQYRSLVLGERVVQSAVLSERMVPCAVLSERVVLSAVPGERVVLPGERVVQSAVLSELRGPTRLKHKKSYHLKKMTSLKDPPSGPQACTYEATNVGPYLAATRVLCPSCYARTMT